MHLRMYWWNAVAVTACGISLGLNIADKDTVSVLLFSFMILLNFLCMRRV